MMKYLIIDDEYIAHNIIQGYADLLPNLSLQKNCYDAIEALQFLNGNQVDLIFLDLNMPKLKGFDFLKTLSKPPKVIVTTAYSEFALEGYELNVVDYLLKPFSFERFLKAVNKASDSNKQFVKPTELEGSTHSKTIFLHSNRQAIQVTLNDILYLEASGNYVKVVLIDNEIMVREKISDMIEKLGNQQFVQVHKSFIVAKAHI
ncbi:MAG: DNA-binding LytR/AlgR family response regulator, partial [Flammeovirgaceae bacterium]